MNTSELAAIVHSTSTDNAIPLSTWKTLKCIIITMMMTMTMMMVMTATVMASFDVGDASSPQKPDGAHTHTELGEAGGVQGGVKIRRRPFSN